MTLEELFARFGTKEDAILILVNQVLDKVTTMSATTDQLSQVVNDLAGAVQAVLALVNSLKGLPAQVASLQAQVTAQGGQITDLQTQLANATATQDALIAPNITTLQSMTSALNTAASST